MKVFMLALTFLPLLALANPIAEAEAAPEPEPEPANGLDKRAVTCVLKGCDIRYHDQPSVSSNAPGQISGCNKRVSFSCYKQGGTSGGTNLWDKIASGQGAGKWITEQYIDPSCVKTPC